MECMGIKRAKWDPSTLSVYIEFSDIIISFHFIGQNRKRPGWKRISYVCAEYGIPFYLSSNVPIKDINHFVRMFIKNYHYCGYSGDIISKWLRKEKEELSLG